MPTECVICSKGTGKRAYRCKGCQEFVCRKCAVEVLAATQPSKSPASAAAAASGSGHVVVPILDIDLQQQQPHQQQLQQHQEQQQHRQPPCPHCAGPLAGLQISRRDESRRCSQCNVSFEYRKYAYRCSDCKRFSCKSCTAGRRQSIDADVDLQAAASGHVVVPNDRTPPESLADPLLASLRQLPEAFPMQPVQWIPRRSKQAAGAALSSLWQNANDAAAAEYGDTAAEISHRLLRASGQLLFRPALHEESMVAAEQGDAGRTAAEIRRRLKLAAGGSWQLLVDECLHELEQRQEQATISRQAPESSGGEGISDQKLQAAAFKSRC